MKKKDILFYCQSEVVKKKKCVCRVMNFKMYVIYVDRRIIIFKTNI